MSMIESYLQDKLNEQQFAAATYAEDHSLILAGAGSGKTRTLTYKIANLIYGHSTHPSCILAVTFTNKAATEMKERLEHIVHDIRNLDASSGNEVEDFDALLTGGSAVGSLPQYTWKDYRWIGTFHSIFLKILKQDIEHLEMKYTKQFTIYDASSDVPSLIKSLLKKNDMQDRLQYREVHGKISQWKNKGWLPEQAGLHCDTQNEERILSIYQQYQKELESSNALDFDDLLLLPKLLFEKSKTVLQKWQEKFSFILVDEAQDTNAIQFALMKLLVGKSGNITFIGDDYQSIYGRRGAVMENFLHVDQRWPSIKTFKLEINYRSKPHIVEAGNAIIQNNKQQYEKDVTAHRGGTDMIRVFGFSDEVDEANQIVELIVKLKEEQDKQWSDFTILYRTNAQSSPFEQVLLTEGIPYKVMGAFKFFDRSEVKDILSYVRYLLNPRDEVGLKRIINTPNRKIGKGTIQKLEEIAYQQNITFCDVVDGIDSHTGVLSPAVHSKIQGFSRMMKEIEQSIDFFNPGKLLDTIVSGIKYKQYVMKVDGDEKGQERMDNIGQLINIAYKYDQPGRESLTQFMEEISLMTSLDDGETDKPDAIMLMSVHASKGLEFPYVFIVGLEENIFPLSKAKFDDKELEEERRGMYVALTRAKDHLFMSYAQSRQQRGQIKYNQPSRFIDELPDHLVKRYEMGSSSGRVTAPNFDEGDRIAHKLFGGGRILELRGDVAIVKFDNPRFNVRKLETRFLKKGD